MYLKNDTKYKTQQIFLSLTIVFGYDNVIMLFGNVKRKLR